MGKDTEKGVNLDLGDVIVSQAIKIAVLEQYLEAKLLANKELSEEIIGIEEKARNKIAQAEESARGAREKLNSIITADSVVFPILKSLVEELGLKSSDIKVNYDNQGAYVIVPTDDEPSKYRLKFVK